MTILLFDGTRWTSIGGVMEENTVMPSLFFDSQGRLWRVQEGSVHPLAQFDGTRWVAAGPNPLRADPTWAGRAWYTPPAMAPDGTFWFLGPSGVERIQAGR